MAAEGTTKGNFKPKWVMMESNPDVINKFIRGLGCPETFGFSDCFGLTEDLLSLIPQPVCGVLLLFPTTRLSEVRKHKQEAAAAAEAGKTEKGEEGGPPAKVPDGEEVIPVEAAGDEAKEEGFEKADDDKYNAYFMKQLVGDACGTVGILHILLNAMKQGELHADPESSIADFLLRTVGLTPHERGEALGSYEVIAAAHEAAAQTGQTAPDSCVKKDYHFIAFVRHGTTLYEMDGTASGPLGHGPTTSDTFLLDAARAITKNYTSLVPDEHFFSVLPFGAVYAQDAPEAPVDHAKKEKEKLEVLVAMGFEEEKCKKALKEASGNMSRATAMLVE